MSAIDKFTQKPPPITILPVGVPSAPVGIRTHGLAICFPAPGWAAAIIGTEGVCAYFPSGKGVGPMECSVRAAEGACMCAGQGRCCRRLALRAAEALG